jgi:dihydropteroate synthase
MGILNVTPDSFSDGGEWADVGAAVDHAIRMVDEGADVIDIGGESTRPGSTPVSVEEELSRLEPVLRALIPSVDVPVSVDTMKPEVAERCIRLGAGMINDVMGLRAEGMLEVCADGGVSVVIMHMEGDMSSVHGGVMEGDYMARIRGFLQNRVDEALDAGISADRIILDPGIGFGKTVEQNLEILRNPLYFSRDYPILTASSRKRFLKEIYPAMDPDEASALVASESIEAGASMVRVHDVARTVHRIRGSKRQL